MNQAPKENFVQTLVDDLRPVQKISLTKTATLWTALGYIIFLVLAWIRSPEIFMHPINPVIGFSLLWAAISWLTYVAAVRSSPLLDLLLVALVVGSFATAGWMGPQGSEEFEMFPISAIVLSAIVWNLIVLFQIAKLSPFKLSKLNLYCLSSALLFGHLISWAVFGSSVCQIESIFYWISILIYFIVLYPFYYKRLKDLTLESYFKTTRLFDGLKRKIFPARLLEGEEAPTFTTDTLGLNPVSILAFSKMKKKVWLVFYRYARCPLCLEHLAELEERQAEFEKQNMEVVLVFESPSDALQPLKTRLSGKRIHIVSDPERKFYKMYGVEKSWMAVLHPAVAWTFIRAAFKGIFQGRVTGSLDRIPAHFLIDEDRKIQRAYYGENIADQISWIEVEAFLKNYRGAALGPAT